MPGNSNSGRRPKSEDQKLVERLSPLEPFVFDALKNGINKGEFRFIQLWFQYRFGKPRDLKQITIDKVEADIPVIKFIKTQDV